MCYNQTWIIKNKTGTLGTQDLNSKCHDHDAKLLVSKWVTLVTLDTCNQSQKLTQLQVQHATHHHSQLVTSTSISHLQLPLESHLNLPNVSKLPLLRDWPVTSQTVSMPLMSCLKQTKSQADTAQGQHPSRSTSQPSTANCLDLDHHSYDQHNQADHHSQSWSLMGLASNTKIRVVPWAVLTRYWSDIMSKPSAMFDTAELLQLNPIIRDNWGYWSCHGTWSLLGISHGCCSCDWM